MKCYLCSIEKPFGGVRYRLSDAVGICQHCGAGVCIDHAIKSDQSNGLILCTECSKTQEMGSDNQHQPIMSSEG